MFYRSFSMLGVKTGIVATKQTVIRDEEYFSGKGGHLHSLLSNFHKLEEVEFMQKNDFYLYMIDSPDIPFQFEIGRENVYLSGDISGLEKAISDKRSSIFGNMGLFSKLYIRALENKGVFSFHSTSMFSPEKNTLYLVLGGSGSGKSTVLLAGLEKGLELFGAELTHFKIKGNALFCYKGPVFQNCRVGNLVEDFPGLIERFQIENLPKDKIWDSYRSVYMGDCQTEQDVLKDPNLVIIFPRIEAFRKNPIFSFGTMEKMNAEVFSSLCEKISPPTWLYQKYMVPSVDSAELQNERMKAATQFCFQNCIRGYWEVLASPQNCLNAILEE